MTTKSISPSDDVIDSRDVIDRIAELESEKESMLEGCPESEYGNSDNPIWKEWEESDEAEELKFLQTLVDELEDYCVDWKYGVTIIHQDYFTEYTEEMLKECGYLPNDLPSWIEIDMEKTAENVKVDYTEAEYNGVTYYAR